MFLKIALLFNGAVGVLLGIPIVRYVLSPVTRGRKQGYESWISLGSIDQFPAGETRLATLSEPGRQRVGRRNGRYSMLGA